MKNSKKSLTAGQRDKILKTLKTRFEKHMHRHKSFDWLKIEARLKDNPSKLWSLNEMEESGGEPDVIGLDKKSGEFIFVDCSAESPAGRRRFCYDRPALDERKEHKPENSALDAAEEMGIEILGEDDYRALQELDEFDLKTSSWIRTPDAIRKHGGALFCDRRYNHVFVYHNGAQSYYAARGFRGKLKV